MADAISPHFPTIYTKAEFYLISKISNFVTVSFYPKIHGENVFGDVLVRKLFI